MGLAAGVSMSGVSLLPKNVVLRPKVNILRAFDADRSAVFDINFTRPP